jgi:hypothetical protein
MQKFCQNGNCKYCHPEYNGTDDCRNNEKDYKNNKILKISQILYDFTVKNCYWNPGLKKSFNQTLKDIKKIIF